MNKTKIEWCDMTWNPVTGCLHGCPYCYARGIARRFGGADAEERSYEGECQFVWEAEATGESHYLTEPMTRLSKDESKDLISPYPYYFDPTFHKYRLDEPQKVKAPQKIFVVSMGDLFGSWVPTKWIVEVFDACRRAPWHTYLFLTKNPERYLELDHMALLPHEDNFWYGSTVTKASDFAACICGAHTFVSVEPIMEDFVVPLSEWVILGAETGNRKEKVIPERDWILKIQLACRDMRVPLFMKDSLVPIIAVKNMVREWPVEMEMPL